MVQLQKQGCSTNLPKSREGRRDAGSAPRASTLGRMEPAARQRSSREVQLEGDGARAPQGCAERGRINPCSVFADLGSAGRCKRAHWGETTPNSCSQPCISYPGTGARKVTFFPLLSHLNSNHKRKKTPRKLGLANICNLSFPSVSLLPAACFSPATHQPHLSCSAFTWMVGVRVIAVQSCCSRCRLRVFKIPLFCIFLAL